MQDALEPLAFLADPVLHRNAQPVDKHLIRIGALASHLFDLAHFDVRTVEIRVEERQAVCPVRPSIGVVRASSNG